VTLPQVQKQLREQKRLQNWFVVVLSSLNSLQEKKKIAARVLLLLTVNWILPT
jgi:hypothetical protein